MPKVELPGMHAEFTDHWIRIAKPGMPYPDEPSTVSTDYRQSAMMENFVLFVANKP